MSARVELAMDGELQARLQRLATSLGCDLSDLVTRALHEFLEESEGHVAAVEEGIRQADAGELVDYEEVKARVAAQLAELKPGP